jgi:hypothetical protein
VSAQAPPARVLIPAIRAAYGSVLLCAPGAVLRLCTGRPASSRARGVTRVLGARHLAQAAVSAWAPRPAVLAAGVDVDLCHAASMLALAATGRAERRAGLADAVAAVALAVAGSAERSRAPKREP